MSTHEIQVGNGFLQNAHKEHEVDIVRPAFMHHVVSPLAHTTVVRTLDTFERNFLENVRASRDHQENERAAFIPTKYEALNEAVSAIMSLDTNLGSMVNSSPVYSTWNTLTEQQQLAAKRFTVFGLRNDSRGHDTVLFGNSNTITDTIKLISEHHPELKLDDINNMTAFLRNPMTPGILRGFSIGGFGFLVSLSGERGHPIGKTWRDDPHKPVLDTTGKKPRTSRAVREAAYEHRYSNATEDTADIRDLIPVIAMRYSSGCPARQLKFRTDNEELSAYNLNLTDAQVELLNAGGKPVIEAVDKHQYNIVRDSIATKAGLLATALEVITK